MRWQDRQKEWEIVLSLQDAKIAELEAALRPFAKLGEELPTGPDWELDEKPVWSFNNAVITLGEMRRAALAIQEKGEG